MPVKREEGGQLEERADWTEFSLLWGASVCDRLQHHVHGRVVDEECSSDLTAGEQATIVRLIGCWLCWSEGQQLPGRTGGSVGLGGSCTSCSGHTPDPGSPHTVPPWCSSPASLAVAAHCLPVAAAWRHPAAGSQWRRCTRHPGSSSPQATGVSSGHVRWQRIWSAPSFASS
ncbi:hypothetical protein E2C01_067747 [Portunus trituberculatus]|uniref:Uncharacterized protein n=1 Tax=Portunus trituberculatus TaxID=210409 RepID=A0A5B7HXK0_PORTR|nr:hypothetical protein [Portunus trituberculatus]